MILASMVDYINRRYCKHIVILEDPIEYTYPHGKNIINQRELGRDVILSADGLRAVLREDPGDEEFRDGRNHPAYHQDGTLGTVDATHGFGRGDGGKEREHVPARSAGHGPVRPGRCPSGRHNPAIVRRKNSGCVPAIEILVVTSVVRNLIREGRSHRIPMAI